MIKLFEILHTLVNDEEINQYIPIDDWRLLYTDYLTTMGFQQNGMNYMSLKNPKLNVYQKKNGEFGLKDLTKKQNYTFKNFDELMNYFDKYQQDFKI